jgi:hypothetical protein
MRLDAILPFRSQEKECKRPESPLLGIAVAPIQGREMVLGHESGEITGGGEGLGRGRGINEDWRRGETERRYRLMLIYHSGEILSYELGRGKGASGSTSSAVTIL